MSTPFLPRFALGLVAAAGFLVNAAAANAGEQIEEIVVTGSHIKGTPEDAPLPVTTLSRDDLALQGSPTSLDLIKNLSFSQGADGETDQFQAGAGAERATVNIRGSAPAAPWCSSTAIAPLGRRTPSAPRRNCWSM